MNTQVYIPWRPAAIRRAGYQRINAYWNRHIRLINVANYMASCGSMLHWNSKLRALEVIPDYSIPYSYY